MRGAGTPRIDGATEVTARSRCRRPIFRSRRVRPTPLCGYQPDGVGTSNGSAAAECFEFTVLAMSSPSLIESRCEHRHDFWSG